MSQGFDRTGAGAGVGIRIRALQDARAALVAARSRELEVVAGRLQFNENLKRVIDGPVSGKYSLFTYKRKTDREYHFVRSGVAESKALKWLHGEH